VQVRGLELQLGTKPQHGWSYFGSATFTDAKTLDNYKESSSVTWQSAGMQFPDTPKLMLGASVQYASGPYLANLSAKHVGKRYTTLTNDEWLDAYTTVDLNLGYRFESTGMLKNPTLRMNLSNLFDTRYLLANSGSGSSVGAAASKNLTYYVGGPRFASVSLSADF